ncbi:hypothetical protein BC830DRAFT_32305 [Chytriomyces sp. MP71]|nr:hypothetical protein BC830DRAFT_32305 [Chytriomyces sp. MP71]
MPEAASVMRRRQSSDISPDCRLARRLFNSLVLDKNDPDCCAQNRFFFCNADSPKRIVRIAVNDIPWWPGPLPSELAQLSQLSRMDFKNNPILTGPLPTEFASLQKLEMINIANTQINGQIPTEFGNILALQEFIAPNARLTGSIPSEFGKLPQLFTLDLSNNSLTGPVPSSIAQLPLVHYSLRSNYLTGPVPWLPDASSSKSTCDFSNNQFSDQQSTTVPYCTLNKFQAALGISSPAVSSSVASIASMPSTGDAASTMTMPSLGAAISTMSTIPFSSATGILWYRRRSMQRGVAPDGLYLKNLSPFPHRKSPHEPHEVIHILGANTVDTSTVTTNTALSLQTQHLLPDYDEPHHGTRLIDEISILDAKRAALGGGDSITRSANRTSFLDTHLSLSRSETPIELRTRSPSPLHPVLYAEKDPRLYQRTESPLSMAAGADTRGSELSERDLIWRRDETMAALGSSTVLLDTQSWTVEEAVKWASQLERVGPLAARKIRDNGIDGKLLLGLTRNDMRDDLGMSVGDRIMFEREVDMLRKISGVDTSVLPT